ncbi:MAG: hypothetical protein WB608_05620 [Terracidiphilus sp.]
MNKKRCTEMDGKLADVLLAPDLVPAKVTAHVEACASCRAELEELRSTIDLLDTWKTPEPSPYFMTRFGARLAELRAAPPASWMERLRARFVYGPQMHIRPLAAMALTVVLLLGGGAYLDISNWDQPPAAPGQAAVVHDLQTLDNNAQLLDQLEEISSNDTNAN